jgi:hypothetical protein
MDCLEFWGIVPISMHLLNKSVHAHMKYDLYALRCSFYKPSDPESSCLKLVMISDTEFFI